MLYEGEDYPECRTGVYSLFYSIFHVVPETMFSEENR